MKMQQADAPSTSLRSNTSLGPNRLVTGKHFPLAEHLPNATLLTYPDAGHGSLFQFPASFVRQATLFLDS